MWTLIKKVIRDIHTGIDGVSYDWVKVTGTCSLATYLWLCWWHLKDDDFFEPVAFATGLCAILASVCAGVAVKSVSKSEPV
jgi:hypothetical protein